MSVVECKIAVDPAVVDKIEAAMSSIDAPGWTILENRLSGQAWIVGYFQTRRQTKESSQKLCRVVEPDWIAGEICWRILADADWANSYKIHFKAWRIGRRHWVPEWERGTYHVQPSHQIVWLDPGMAFGTGNHESTRLCCERLIEYADACEHPVIRRRSPAREANPGTPRRNAGVIDAGCGSGILAISAARFGLGPVIGFDNDPIAVRVSRENAVLNRVAAQIDFFERDLSAGLAGRQAGLVLANIHTSELRQAAKALVRAVAPGGWLALSGILAVELDDLRAVFLTAARHEFSVQPNPTGSQPFTPSRRESPVVNDQRCSRTDWKAFSRGLGEWSDLLLVRPPS